jgi:DUF2934 family protein
MKSDSNFTEIAELSTEVALREQIERRAYHLWLSVGGRHGEDLRHWLQAESEVLKAISQDQAERSSTPKTSPTVKLSSSKALNEGVAKK